MSYLAELEKLRDTYTWAQKQDVDGLASAIDRSFQRPLIAVGSGGSLTAATYLANLHQVHAGQVAAVSTPLSVYSSVPHNSEAAVWFLSASGENIDIRRAFRFVASREPRVLTALVASSGSELGRDVLETQFADLVEFSHPARKDGFLATNSLLATCVLLTNGYFLAERDTLSIPNDIASLLPDYLSAETLLRDISALCEPLWSRRTLVVLHGPSTLAAAVDLESKFTEAALGNAQYSDYRNFAHGRHHWLAKRGSDSAVLAFTTPEDKSLAEKTLNHLPGEVPVVRFDLEGGVPACQLVALFLAFYVVGSAGIARDIDPGRPRVPAFGRRIYHLKSSLSFTAPSIERIAIERKAKKDFNTLKRKGTYGTWRRAFRKYLSNLKKATYGSIVFDYDGTLVDSRARADGVGESVISELNRFLKAGVPIGVATGRGKSVRFDLQKALPQSVWDMVLLGYYNGAQIGFLGDDSLPNPSPAISGQLARVLKLLQTYDWILEDASLTIRETQITLEPFADSDLEGLWQLTQQVVHTVGADGVTVLRSEHSVDILSPGVSKLALLDALRRSFDLPETVEVLAIGDRGAWPGNDFELLGTPYSLSVDQVSLDPNSCWNISCPGIRGVQATLAYCRMIQSSPHGEKAVVFVTNS